MRPLYLFCSLFLIQMVSAQKLVLDSKQYQVLKQNNTLTGAEFIAPSLAAVTQHYAGPQDQKTGLCDCLIPLDSTFQLAMLPNDDLYSNSISLPFNFNFYGTSYDSLYINNNGNISFSQPYFTFTAYPFPDPSFNMIAPFWADVDTRSTNGGNVWYKLNPHSLVIVWDHVGYFNMMEDKLNTFQLIISDGLDTLIPNGNNVSFCYGDMHWTTGSASGGSNGFGGSPATVGVNIGNGINYFQVGQFDAPGVAFDGPYSANDGVDFLDGQVPVAKSIVYRIKTDERGEFSFVLPSRTDNSFEKEYYLLLTAPARFQTEFNGVLLTENFLLATDAPRDADGVRDLGVLKIVRE